MKRVDLLAPKSKLSFLALSVFASAGLGLILSSLPVLAEVPASAEVPAKTLSAESSKLPTLKVEKLPTLKVEKVPVELEWEEVLGAKVYELEFQNLSGEKQTTFKSPNRIFKFKMRVGRYKVRSRVADDRNVFGAWSPLTEFTVEPKAPYLDEKSVRTTGKLNAKTLTSDVTYRWGTSKGAKTFRLVILDSEGKVVHEEITTKYYYIAQLPAGEYTATLAAIGEDGISSEPVTLPGKVVIQSARLRAPGIVFDKDNRLPLKGDLPVARWKASSRSLVSGLLEYRYFFGEEWMPVQDFKSVQTQEVVLEAAKKPGRYRISLWAESPGLLKSEPALYEFVIKPKEY